MTLSTTQEPAHDIHERAALERISDALDRISKKRKRLHAQLAHFMESATTAIKAEQAKPDMQRASILTVEMVGENAEAISEDYLYRQAFQLLSLKFGGTVRVKQIPGHNVDDPIWAVEPRVEAEITLTNTNLAGKFESYSELFKLIANEELAFIKDLIQKTAAA